MLCKTRVLHTLQGLEDCLLMVKLEPTEDSEAQASQVKTEEIKVNYEEQKNEF